MKITLTLSLSNESDTIFEQVKTYCEKNQIEFEAFQKEGSEATMVVFYDSPLPNTGDYVKTIVSRKKISQFLLNNIKNNQEEYFSDSFGGANWARKLKVDPDEIRRFTGGKVILTTPIHLLDKRVYCLNYEKPVHDRIYVVEGSSKPYRKFDGKYHKHCSGCPFDEGCITCTLP